MVCYASRPYMMVACSYLEGKMAKYVFGTGMLSFVALSH